MRYQSTPMPKAFFLAMFTIFGIVGLVLIPITYAGGSGRVPLHRLKEIRPMRGGGNVAVFKHDVEGRPVMTLATKGLKPFADEIARLRPGLPIRVGIQTRFAERMPGWSGFKK